MIIASLLVLTLVGVTVLAGLALLFLLSSLSDTCRYYDEQ